MKHVWIHPKGNQNKVLILTEEALSLANPEPVQVRRFQEALPSEALPSTWLAMSMQVIPLISIQKLQSDREKAHIRIVHGIGRKPARSLAQFPSLGERDDAFEALGLEFGPNFRIKQPQSGKLGVGALALAKALLSVLGAFFLRQSIVHASENAPGAGVERGLSLFAPHAVELIGLLLAAHYFIQFYRYTQQESPHLELERN